MNASATAAEGAKQADDRVPRSAIDFENALRNGFGDRYQVASVLKETAGFTAVAAIDREYKKKHLLKAFQTARMPAGVRLRLDRDMPLLKRIENDCLAHLVDWYSSGDDCLAIFESVQGQSLYDLLSDQPLTVRQTLTLAERMLEALADVHAQHAIHGNVITANVICPEQAIAKAVLVGIGPPMSVFTEYCDDEEAMRLSQYCSPEQSGSIEHDAGPWSDLYSLGIVLYTALAGRPPFEGSDVGEVLYEHMTAPVPRLDRRGVKDVPRALEELIRHLLKKDPTARYQTAEAVLFDVRAISERIDHGEPDPKVIIGVSDQKCTISEPAFVGRESELKQVSDLIAETRRGHGGLMMIEAVSGGGKSRFLSEVAQLARRDDLWVLRGQETNDVGRRSLQLFDGVVENLLSKISGKEELADLLRESLKEEQEMLASVLPKLAPLLGEKKSAKAPEEFGEARAIRAICTFLDALGQTREPVVVMLDDCQWADELSLKILQQWNAREQAEATRNRVLVVSAFRSEEVQSDHALRKIEPLDSIALPTLSREELHQLTESMAGKLPDEVFEVVYRLADGSPFMASAVLRGLFECGTLYASEAGWEVDAEALEDTQSSEEAGDLLTRRVDLLSEEAIELLSIGAVLGKEFSLDMVASLASSSTTQGVVDSLDEARQKRLVWMRPNGTSCVFMHDKIRASVLNHLSEIRSRAVHRRAASLLCESPDAPAAEIAYHFDASGDSKSALKYAISAAAEARKRYALDIAEQQYLIAERGVPHGDEVNRFVVAQGLGDVYMLRGEYPSASRYLLEASQLAKGRHAQAEVQGRLAELSFKRGDMQQAVGEYERALRILGVYVPGHIAVFAIMLGYQGFLQMLHTAFPKLFLHRRQSLPGLALRLQLELLSGLTHAYWYASSPVMVFWAHLVGMNKAERYLPSEELADAYSSHGVGMTLFAFFSRAETYCKRSLEIRTELGNAWGQGQSLHYWGVVLYAASRFAECTTKCRESVRLLERMGDYQQVHTARYQIAASLYHLGDFGGAVDVAVKNQRSGLATGDSQASGINLDVWARADAVSLPEDVIDAELERDRFDPQGAAQVALAHGVWLINQQRESEAVEVFEQALQQSHGKGVKNAYTLPLLAWLATALRLIAQRRSAYSPGDRQNALQKARRAAWRAVLSAWMSRNDKPRALREQAATSAMLGRQRRARRLLLRSLLLAKQQRARHEYAESLIMYGEVGKELGWHNADRRHRSGLRIKGQLELKLRESRSTKRSQEGVASLSLIDRFDTVLESGRNIASALREKTIYDQTHSAALRLLRGQECVIWSIDDESSPKTYRPSAGQLSVDIDASQIETLFQAMGELKPTPVELTTQEAFDGLEGSCLAAPIMVRGKIHAILIVSHQELQGLFKDDELRLAAFVAAIAGAALENAEGFQQLQDLNFTLEARVAERTASAESKARELARSNDELKRIADELRTKEEQLQVAMHAAEAASNAKSQFLATMSHEIRTPMNGILGMTELALRSSLTPQLQTYMQTVKQSGEALLTLLNDVLDLSKIEAGKMELESIEFDLRQTVGDAVKLLSAAAAKKQLELLCNVATRAPEYIVGDPSRLRQIIVNLIGNAIKFTDSGEIRVGVSLVPKLRGGGALRFAIADTGLGIPEEKQQHVFGAFQQSDGSTTRKYGGTGLGLSISSELVDLMGGRIWLESEVGEGTTFFFEIPLVTSDGQLTPTEKQAALEGTTTLVFSENANGMRIYSELLASQSADVESIDNPDKILNVAVTLESSATKLAVIDLSCQEEQRQRMVQLWSPVAEQGDWKTVWLAPIDWMGDQSCELAGTVLVKPVMAREFLQAVQFCLNGEAQTTADQMQALPAAQTLKVLLVDDSPVNLQVGLGLLETQGHEVITADDGFEALRQLRAHQFDAVLMDLEMPGMDGFEATRKIRLKEVGTDKHMPVIAMTAHAVGTMQAKCEQAGMDACLTKPVQPDQLFAQLEKLTTEVAAQV